MSLQDFQNPGTINPADQSFVVETRPQHAQGPASTSLVNSSGDIQLPAPPPSLATSSGPQGLPVEINAGHDSQVRSQPAIVAATFPPARNINADTNRPGGLPVNVMVK